MKSRQIVQRTGAVLISTMLLTSVSLTAFATPQPSGNQPAARQQVDQQARETFLSETAELRREMAVKRATMRSLMAQDNPDTNAIAQLAGELFDLREQIRAKAREAGFSPGAMLAGMGRHPCSPGGQGGPMSRGPHMMGGPAW